MSAAMNEDIKRWTVRRKRVLEVIQGKTTDGMCGAGACAKNALPAA